MEIKRIGSQPSAKGPAEWFTGTVRMDPLFNPAEPGRVAGVSVTFEPAARTAWHTHPLGQTLVVTAGVGRVQRFGCALEVFAQTLHVPSMLTMQAPTGFCGVHLRRKRGQASGLILPMTTRWHRQPGWESTPSCSWIPFLRSAS